MLNVKIIREVEVGSQADFNILINVTIEACERATDDGQSS